MRPVGRVLAGSVAAALGGLVGVVGVPGHLPAAYADGTECAQIQSGNESEPTTTASDAIVSLQIQRAHEALDSRGQEPGGGQTVALLDSGVSASATQVFSQPVVQADLLSATREVEDYQGTALAGIIAGRPLPVTDAESADSAPLVGFAPAAKIVDVQVYDVAIATEGQPPVGVELDRVVAGLDWVARNAKKMGIDVANVSLTLPNDEPTLERAVEAVTDAGVILVASAGDIPGEDEPGSERFLDEEGALRGGIDARDDIWPAGYDDVIAVSASAPRGGDAAATVLQNSQIDVAVPTAGGVSYSLTGQPCQLPGTSSKIAAAEVSAILALIKSAYPRETNEQILSRLFATATGSGADQGGVDPDEVDPANDLLTGAGVAQPVEAILRPLRPAEDGTLETTQIAQEEIEAEVPTTPPDVLAQVREDAVWFGLLAGGLLAVAMLLRPVLSRRAGGPSRR